MSEKQMYNNPVVLSSITHKDLKISPVNNYKFAGDMNSCIVACQEFLEAAKHYPIVFSKSNSAITPVVMLGINKNQFINSDGKWEERTYIPAFIRRYPFILAEGLSGDGSLTVCIDMKYEGFNDAAGERLFTDKGEGTAVLKNATGFLRQYHAQYEVTKTFINTIKDLNIFKAVDANITLVGGKKLTIKNLLMIDEQALLKLPDEELIKLVRKGFMAWIYAHLYSLTNFRRIIK